ncbi:hypothetical protein D3C72_1295870 [compost metagenome]
MNSAKIGPNKKPSVANACPPQLRPDSTRNSETQTPFFAKYFACISADLKSLTFRVIFLSKLPSSFCQKAGNSATYAYSFGFIPAERITEDCNGELAYPLNAASASEKVSSNAFPFLS